MSGTSKIRAGTWRGDALSLKAVLILVFQIVGENDIRGKLHKEEHALVAFPVLPDRDAVRYLGELVHDVIDLRGPDTDARGLQYRHPTARRRLRPLYRCGIRHSRRGATSLDRREVGRSIPGKSGSFQKAKGHGGAGASQTSSPCLRQKTAMRIFIVCTHLHTQPRGLKLPCINRKNRGPHAEAAVDVRAACERVEMDVFLDGIVGEFEAFG